MTTENNNRRPQWPPVVGIVSSELVSCAQLELRTKFVELMDAEHASKMESEWQDIGRQMRARREAASLSLRQLANHLKISAPFLGDMERGFRHYKHKYVTAALAHITANNLGDQFRGQSAP